MDLAKIIKELRKKNKMTQRHLAKAIGLNTSEISNYETGKAVPPVSKLMAMADIFDVDESVFFEEESIAVYPNYVQSKLSWREFDFSQRVFCSVINKLNRKKMSYSCVVKRENCGEQWNFVINMGNCKTKSWYFQYFFVNDTNESEIIDEKLLKQATGVVINTIGMVFMTHSDMRMTSKYTFVTNSKLFYNAFMHYSNYEPAALTMPVSVALFDLYNEVFMEEEYLSISSKFARDKFFYHIKAIWSDICLNRHSIFWRSIDLR